MPGMIFQQYPAVLHRVFPCHCCQFIDQGFHYKTSMCISYGAPCRYRNTCRSCMQLKGMMLDGIEIWGTVHPIYGTVINAIWGDGAGQRRVDKKRLTDNTVQPGRRQTIGINTNMYAV